MLNRFLIIVLAIVLNSCETTEFLKFSDGWKNTEPVEFNFKGDLNSKNISLILRHNNDYDYANIFLITELNSTQSLTQTDTLEFLLSNPSGQWLGDKKLTLIEHKLPYKQSIILAKDSLYSLKVRSSMRLNDHVRPIANLEGIIGLGLLIEEDVNEKK